MLSSIGKLSKSILIKVLVAIIILPFIFWGMGDVFRGGNQNVVATIDSKKVSSKEFVEHVNRISLNEEQINEAVQKLKTILPLKNKLTKAPWLGSRPTIADSLPMIGKAPKHKNLWFNFGHNHIGLSTSAGSGVVLADMIENKKTSINIDPFLPDRFII